MLIINALELVIMIALLVILILGLFPNNKN